MNICHSCVRAFEGPGQTCGKEECEKKWMGECVEFARKVAESRAVPWQVGLARRLSTLPVENHAVSGDCAVPQNV